MGARMKRFIGSTADSDWVNVCSDQEAHDQAQAARIKALEAEIETKDKKITSLSEKNQTLSTQNKALEAVIHSRQRRPIRKNLFEQVSDLFLESPDDEENHLSALYSKPTLK
jgi:hypothetical protein